MSSSRRPNPALQLSKTEMRALGYKIVDILVGHFESFPSKPVAAKAGRPELEKRLRERLPERGADITAVLQQLDRDVFGNIMHLDHPRFFAFVPSPSNFVSVMADTLASGFNVFAGTWLEASGPAEVEVVTIDWLRQLCDLPKKAAGLFVSGGSMSNLIALAVARRMKLHDRVQGAVVYFSDQTHSSVERSLSVLGFDRSQIRKLPADRGFRLNLSDLRRQVANDRATGRVPFCVIANAGTTNTGAVDPLPELAEFCRKEKLWLHIDGAYGAPAVLCRKGRSLFRGLGKADSLSIDPHKWLFQPYEIGCVLVRDGDWLKDAFRVLPEYLRDTELTEGEINFCDYGIQLTRSFRALKLWMSLKVFGVESFRMAVTRGIGLAELAERTLREAESWEIVTPASIGIVTFRYTSPGLSASEADTVNQGIVDRMMHDGFAMVSSTVLRGRTVLRLCTINPRAKGSDIVRTVRKLERFGKELSHEFS